MHLYSALFQIPLQFLLISHTPFVSSPVQQKVFYTLFLLTIFEFGHQCLLRKQVNIHNCSVVVSLLRLVC